MIGNKQAVDQYLEKLDLPDEEKDCLRCELMKQFERNIESRGAERLDILNAPEPEMDEIPFDELVKYLMEGNTAAFERFFDNLEIYEAERIRTQCMKLFTESKNQ